MNEAAPGHAGDRGCVKEERTMISIPVQALLAGDRIVSTPDKPDTDPMIVSHVGHELGRVVFEYTCSRSGGTWEGRCALLPGQVVSVENRIWTK